LPVLIATTRARGKQIFRTVILIIIGGDKLNDAK
jgi:hypothetical protein